MTHFMLIETMKFSFVKWMRWSEAGL